jgi:preprotein translocase SecE subunit
MADEKKAVKETQENGKKPNKFVAFFKNLPQNIATPFKNMWHELKKVTWPTKQDLIKYSCIVLLFMAFMGIVIGLLDMGSSRLVTAVSSLKGTEEQIIIDTSADDAAETVEAAAEGAEEAVDEAAEAVSDAAEAAEETAAEAAAEAAEAVEEAATEAAETVEEAATEAVEAVEEAATEAAETVEEAATEAAGAAEEAATEAVEAVEEATEQAPAEGN